jgi:hypothetical protein
MLKMIDYVVILFIIAPYVSTLLLNHLISKDIMQLYQAITKLQDEVKVLSTHAASMDSKINYWNPYSKKGDK